MSEMKVDYVCCQPCRGLLNSLVYSLQLYSNKTMSKRLKVRAEQADLCNSNLMMPKNMLFNLATFSHVLTILGESFNNQMSSYFSTHRIIAGILFDLSKETIKIIGSKKISIFQLDTWGTQYSIFTPKPYYEIKL